MVSIREHRFPFLPKVGNWNRFTANTGGTLVEKCCHFFDLMRHVAGADPVRVVRSGGQDVNHLDEVYDGERADMLDNAYVIVDFANGVRGALDLSMFAEGGRHEQEITVVGDLAKVETTFPGDRVLIGPRDRSGVREVAAPAEVPYLGFHGGSSYIEHVRFIDCVRAGRGPEVTVDDGLWSVAMGVAAHRSIAEGRPIDTRPNWACSRPRSIALDPSFCKRLHGRVASPTSSGHPSPASPRGRATIEDVAAAAGVSVATVSRALRNLPNVASATRERVAAIAEQMSYRADPAASRLATGRSRSIAVAVPLLNGWYFSQVVAGAEAICATTGYDMIVVGVSTGAARRSIVDEAASIHRRVDGVIFVDIHLPIDDVDGLADKGLRVVTIGESTHRFPSVGIDDVAVGDLATSHLLSLGPSAHRADRREAHRRARLRRAVAASCRAPPSAGPRRHRARPHAARARVVLGAGRPCRDARAARAARTTHRGVLDVGRDGLRRAAGAARRRAGRLRRPVDRRRRRPRPGRSSWG